MIPRFSLARSCGLGLLLAGAVLSSPAGAQTTTSPATPTEPAPIEIKIPRDGDVIAVFKTVTASDGSVCKIAAGYSGVAMVCAEPPTPPAPVQNPQPAPRQ